MNPSSLNLDSYEFAPSYSIKEQVLVVTLSGFALFLCSYISNALSVAIPHVATHYGALPQEASYAVSAYTIALACFLLPSSLLARVFNNRIIFIIGALSCGLVSVLLPQSPSLFVLVVGRVIQGACASLMLATAMALISTYVNKDKRFVAIGIAVCLTYIGVSLSLSTSGFITELWGYEVMFYGSGIALLVLGLAALNLRSESHNDKEQDCFESHKEAVGTKKAVFVEPKFTFSRGLIAKTLVFVAGIGCSLFSLSALSQRSYAIYLLILGVVLIGIVLYFDYQKYLEHKRELKALNIEGELVAHPALKRYRPHEILIPVHILLHNKAFTLGFLVSFFSYISVMAEPVLLALFSQLTLGLSASISGVIVVVQPITIAIVSFFTGRIVKALGGPVVVTLGLVIQTATLLSFAFIDETTTVQGLIIRQLLVGTGFALFSAPNTTLMTLSVKEEHYALASAMQQLGRTIGQATSYALVTLLLSALVHATPKTFEYAIEFANASVVILVISASLGFAAILCAYLSTNVQSNKNAESTKTEAA